MVFYYEDHVYSLQLLNNSLYLELPLFSSTLQNQPSLLYKNTVILIIV